MTTLAHASPLDDGRDRRLTRLVVGGIGALVVPVLAATGLALPLPSVIYRLAIDVARTTESVTLRVGGFAVDLGGDDRTASPGRIVLMPAEQARASAGARGGDAGAATPAAEHPRTVGAEPRRGERRAGPNGPGSVAGVHANAASAAASPASLTPAKDPIGAETEQADAAAPATSSAGAAPPADPSPAADVTPPASTPTPTAAPPPARPATPATRTTPATPPAPAPSTAEPADKTVTAEPTDTSVERAADDRVDVVLPPVVPVPSAVEESVEKTTEKANAVVEGVAGAATGTPQSPRPLPRLS